MVTKGDGGPAPTKDIKFAPRNVAKGEVHAMEAMLRAGNAPPSQLAITPEMLEKLAAARTKIHDALGKVVLAMSATPRYKHLSIGDITHLVFDPLLRERIAIASPAKPDGTPVETDVAGIAIWASVSDNVDKKIREQIGAGVFPVRLQAEDWTSGTIHWLLDVLAPNAQLATAVVTNFKQVVKEGQLFVHPRVAATLDAGVIKNKVGGVRPSAQGEHQMVGDKPS